MQFALRTCFFFAAVNPSGMSPADATRILLFEMLAHANDTDEAARIADDEAFFTDKGPEWCGYMAGLANVIPPAIGVFMKALPGIDSRHRKNVATLLAGAFVALEGRAPTEVEAAAMAETYRGSIELHAEAFERDDSMECLQHLFRPPNREADAGLLACGRAGLASSRDCRTISPSRARRCASRATSRSSCEVVTRPAFSSETALPASTRSSATRNGRMARGRGRCGRSMVTLRLRTRSTSPRRRASSALSAFRSACCRKLIQRSFRRNTSPFSKGRNTDMTLYGNTSGPRDRTSGRNGRTSGRPGETAANERVDRSLLYLSLYPCRRRPFRPVVLVLRRIRPTPGSLGFGSPAPSTQPVVISRPDFPTRSYVRLARPALRPRRLPAWLQIGLRPRSLDLRSR